METILKVLFDGTQKFVKPFNTDWTLVQAREFLKQFTSEPYAFLKINKDEIPDADEAKTQIKDIIQNQSEINLVLKCTVLMNGEEFGFKIPEKNKSMAEFRTFLEEMGYSKVKFIVKKIEVNSEFEQINTIQECLNSDSGFIYILNKEDVQNKKKEDFVANENHQLRSRLENENEVGKKNQLQNQDVPSSLDFMKVLEAYSPKNEEEKKDESQNQIRNQEENQKDQAIQDAHQQHIQRDFALNKQKQRAQEYFQLASHYPESLERSIQYALSYINFLQTESLPFNNGSSIDLNLNEALQTEVNNIEKLAEDQNMLSHTIRERVKELNNLIQAKRFIDLQNELSQILNEIMPLDIQLIKYLIEKADSATLQVSGKDIILFLGYTGSGKSTTIHFLAGSKMENTLQGTICHIAPTDIAIKDAEAVKISPLTSSETRYITAVPIVESGISIILCDCAGFFDTSGPAVDIANSISIIKAVKCCKSVRPVIILSQKSNGDKYEGLQKVAHILTSMVNDLKDNFETFQYIFTKFDEKERAGLAEIIQDIITKINLNNKGDQDHLFVELLENIRDQAEQNKITFLDPLVDNYVQLRRKIIKREEIINPKNVFKFYITQSSQNAIKGQATLHRKSIIEAFSRGDLPFVLFKLSELQYIAEELNNEQLKIMYKDLCIELTTEVNKQYLETTSNLKQFLDLENKILPEQIQQYQQAQKIDKINDELKVKHLSQFSKDIKTNVQYGAFIEKAIRSLMEKAKKMKITDKRLSQALVKISQLDQFYPKKISNLSILLNSVKEKIEQLTGKFLKEAFEYQDLEGSPLILDEIDTAVQNLKTQLPNEFVDQIQEKLDDRFIKYLQKLRGNLDNVCNQRALGVDQIKQIKDYIGFLKNSKQAYKKYPILNLKPLQSQLIEMDECILALFKQSISAIIQIQQQSEDANQPLNRVKNVIQNSELVQNQLEQAQVIHTNFVQLQNYTTDDYYKVINLLITDINEYITNICSNISQLQFSQNQELYKAVKTQIDGLSKLEWIDNYSQGFQAGASSQIQNLIEQQYENLLNQANGIQFSLERFDGIDQISSIFFHMEQIQRITFKNQTLIHEHHEKIVQYFQQQVDLLLKNIEDLCLHSSEESESLSNSSIVNINYKDFEQSLKCLQKLDSIKLDMQSFNELKSIKEGSQSLLSKLKQQIDKYHKEIQIKIEELFQEVKNVNDKNDNKELNKAGHELQMILIDLQGINEKTDLFRNQFDQDNTILNSFDLKLTEYAEDFANEIKINYQQCKTNPDQILQLKQKLNIARALQYLDKFNNSEIKFKELYRDYNKMHSDLWPQSTQTLLDNIANYEIEKVIDSFELLSSQSQEQENKNQLDMAQKKLRQAVKKLQQDTMIMASKTKFRNNVSEELITDISENIKILNNCEPLSKYINQDNQIDKDIQEIIKIVNKHYRTHLTRLIQQVKANLFIEAIEDADLIYQQYQDFDPQFDTESQELLKSFNTTQNKQLNELYQDYEKMKILNFKNNPPKAILEELQNCIEAVKQGSDIIIFRTTKGKLEQLIKTKFREEIDRIKKTKVKSDKNQMIVSCKNFFNYIPSNIAEELEPELETALSCTKEQEDERISNIQNAKQNKEWEQLLYLLSEDKNQDNSEGVQQIQQIFLDEIKAEFSKIKIQQVSGLSLEVRQQLEYFNKLHEIYKTNFNKEAHPFFKQLQKQFIDGFVKSMKIFYNEINQEENQTPMGSVDNSGNEQILVDHRATAGGMDNLIQFLNFREEDQQLCLTYIPQFDELFQKKLQKMIENITQIQTELGDSIQLEDFEKLFIYYAKIKGYAKNKQLIMKQSFQQEILRQFRDIFQEVQPIENFKSRIDSLVEEKIDAAKAGVDSVTQEIKLDNMREEHYKQINKNMDAISIICSKGSQLYPNIQKRIEEIQNTLNENVQNLQSDIANPTEEKLTSESYLKTFNICQSNLMTLKKTLKPDFIQQNIDIQAVNKNMVKVCKNIAQRIPSNINSSAYQKVTDVLIVLKKIAVEIPFFVKQIEELIDQQLEDFKKQYKKKGLQLLALQLSNTEMGSIMLSQHKVFAQINLDLFQEMTNKHDIDYVLENMRASDGTLLNKDQLKEDYQIFWQTYEKIIKQAALNSNEIPQLIDQLVAELQVFYQKDNALQKWQGQFKQKFPQIIAKISAIWTLQKSSEYFENSEDKDEVKSTFIKPHPAQIIAIFQLLGMGGDSNNKSLENTLVQVGTGEGKSLILAITSAVYALIGAEINCACYSTYLSERDYNDCEQLFQTLKVNDYIHYGTFNKLCERIINLHGNFRDKINDLITKNEAQIEPIEKIVMRIQILLIDEVDVFFSKNVYGEVYSPQTSLKSPLINQLLDLIWAMHVSKTLSFEKVEQTKEYIDVQGLFSNWKDLIKEAVKDMISDVMSYQDHQYELEGLKIGYKEQDQIEFNISYGYKTIFAYYAELEKLRSEPNFTPESIAELEKNMREASCIGINCGNFSYAEIPQSFQYIMGVSGTLESLNSTQLGMIKQSYKIEKRVYIPSVFGKNNLSFDPQQDLIICEEQDYYNAIIQDINAKIDNDRAVLVFFESKEKLMEFYLSHNYNMLKQQTNLLTEKVYYEQKLNIIMKSTQSKRITLFSKCFGRGTDFKTFDKKLIDRGGVHVIQTFFSEDLSEEVQIKGRTARQGQQGSFKIIVLENSLEKFQITKQNGLFKSIFNFFQPKQEEVQHKQMTYDMLSQHRNLFSKNQYKHNIKKAEQAKEEHKKACDLQELIYKGEQEEIYKLLLKYNIGAALQVDSRTIILMDATGSMGSLINKCISSVSLMFERACQILADNDKDQKCFKLQFVAYRNYNAPEDQLLQYSPWTSKSEDLKTFLGSVSASYGWGNEAIEAGLWFANEENKKQKITQIILIGDMPPNTKDELDSHRKECHNYMDTKFAAVQTYDIELKNFIDQKIPVHAFYVEEAAKASFEDIAVKTGGQCSELDIHSNQGAEVLTKLVTQEILRSVGGEKMVDQYQRKYRE